MSGTAVFGQALVIGSQTFGLAGVHTDVDRTSALLRERGFIVDRRVGEDATRAGILDGIDALCDSLRPDHAAVVYFSGHGGRVVDVEPGVSVPFLVPTDYHSEESRPFRGILGQELSLALMKVLGRTQNVTLILDCCHSGRMARDTTLVPKWLSNPTRAQLSNALAELRASDAPLDRLHVEGHPSLVRVVAANENQPAFEIREGERSFGLFTHTLLKALDTSRNSDLNWATLSTWIRDTVRRRAPSQRPEIEGPIHRLPFSQSSRDIPSSFMVSTASDGQCVVDAGALLGIHPGDEFTIVAGDAPQERGGERATARVTEVRAQDSLIEVDATLPAGARAIRTHRAAPRSPIVLTGREPMRSTLAGALEASALLEVADEHSAPLARVDVGARWISVQGRHGDLMEPAPIRLDRVPTIVRTIERMAAAREVLRVCDAYRDESALVQVEIGRVEGDTRRGAPSLGRPLDSESVVHPGDSLYVRINNGTGHSLYVHVLDIGLSGSVTLLTTSAPSGIKLGPERSYTLGSRAGILRGMPLFWPESVPMDCARPEQFVVIAASQPQDLRSLETWRATVGDIDARDAKLEHSEYLGVFRRELLLAPWLAEDCPVDPSPVPTFTEPRQLTLTMSDLWVHTARGVFGGALRIDTLVVDRDSRPAPTYQAKTLISPQAPTERPLFDDVVIYEGEAGHVVDIYIWASRDGREHHELSALLKSTSPTPSSSTLARRAYGKLVAMTGLSVGLYRGSVESASDYCVTPPNSSWLRRAGECSFVLAVKGTATG